MKSATRKNVQRIKRIKSRVVVIEIHEQLLLIVNAIALMACYRLRQIAISLALHTQIALLGFRASVSLLCESLISTRVGNGAANLDFMAF